MRKSEVLSHFELSLKETTKKAKYDSEPASASVFTPKSAPGHNVGLALLVIEFVSFTVRTRQPTGE